MAKQKDIRGLLQKQIEDLTKKLAVSRASFVYYQSIVREQEDELAKLNNALASLDGTLQSAPTAKQYDFVPAANLIPSVFSAAKPQTATVNGEEIIVEPGFHVEKNSFGEDCIVPDGVKYAPAAEPAATPDTNSLFGAGSPALPAITSGDQFDDPADIISAELPNG